MAANNNINLIVNQKSSFRVVFNLNQSNGTPLDLSSGYEVDAAYKADISSGDSSRVTITSEITNAAEGEITLSLTKEQTDVMKNPRYVYDVVITDLSTGFRTRIMEGSIKVAAGVTPITD